MHCRWRTVQKSFEWAHTEKGACPRDRWYAVNNKSRNSLVHSHSYFGPWESTVTSSPPLPLRMTCMPSTVQVLVQHLPLAFTIHTLSFTISWARSGGGRWSEIRSKSSATKKWKEKLHKICTKRTVRMHTRGTDTFHIWPSSGRKGTVVWAIS